MKIFVSSTTKDLGKARKKVCERLLQLDIQPVSMDWYKSDPRSPQKLDDEMVQSCDAFIIIVGHLYGESPKGKRKSFTELEYDAAVAAHQEDHIYTFLASDDYPVSSSLREDDETNKKLLAFRERLTRDHAPRYFDNEDQLCTEVIVALASVAKSLGKMLLPKLPTPYIAHPYALQENFTGRRTERALLTDWIGNAWGKPMLSLVGMGGLGKSALSWYWLHEDVLQNNIKLSGVIWWSFYEPEATFESFITHALFYASDGTITAEQAPTEFDRIQNLRFILQDSPFLIILDGAERLLRAYHRLDAAYRGDDFEKDDQGRHLLCADPRAGQFLQALAASGVRSRTLITTRLHPKELDGSAGCRREELQRFEPQDAYEFMRHQGITGPRGEILHACEPYGFLPLCLRLLSGAIREDPESPDDIKAAQDWQPPENLVRKEHHILAISYDTMAQDRRDLLSRIAALRGPVDYKTARILAQYEDENELKKALRELVSRGLLFWQPEKLRYDLHPIIRQYAYDRLGDKQATHRQLQDYFETVPETEKIEILDDLLPAIELFHHTVQAGGYEEARVIYHDRLHKSLYYQLGAYDEVISLLGALFPQGRDKPPRLKAESDQAWTMAVLSNAYDNTGQSIKAAGLFERHNKLKEKLGEKKNLAVGLGNLAISQTLLGELQEAQANLLQRINIAREIKEEFSEAAGHMELGRLLTYRGEYDESKQELEKAIKMFAERGDEQAQCLSWSYCTFRALRMADGPGALEAIAEARKFWELWAKHIHPNERDLVMILWLSGAAKRMAGDVTGAETYLNEALDRCRKIRLVELEAQILLEQAKLHWQSAAGSDEPRIKQARELCREAREIAQRCEYRLQLNDINNFTAEMDRNKK